MADYFLQFSCEFDVGSADNAMRALAIRDQFAEELHREGEFLGFQVETDAMHKPCDLWIWADEHGDPEQVIKFVLRCAEAFNLTGLWGFTWSLSCSRPRIGAFGGGAQLIDLGKRASLDWIDCEHWLAMNLQPDEADSVAVPEAPP